MLTTIVHSWCTPFFYLLCRALSTCSLKNGVVASVFFKCEDVNKVMECIYQSL